MKVNRFVIVSLCFLFVFLHDSKSGISKNPHGFGFHIYGESEGKTPYNDTEVTEAHDVTAILKNSTKCEDRKRGEFCCIDHETAVEEKKLINDWCYALPRYGYYGRRKVEIFQSESGNYPPRTNIYTCKWKSTRSRCPNITWTQEYDVVTSQYLWVKIKGVWRKEWVVLRFPWHCKCRSY